MKETSRNPPDTVGAPAPAAISPVVSDDSADSLDVAAWRRGEQAAARRLYDRHAAVVLSLCRSSVAGRCTEEAQDAMQETFIRAFRTIDRLEQPEGFRPWIYAIARFVCSERRRALGRRRRHEDRAMTIASIEPGQTSAEDDASRGEQLRRLDAALDRLPDDERLAIHLYYIEADPVKAATTALGISRSGFYKLLSRARERLSVLVKEVVIS